MAITLSASFVAAVLVFMSSDQTISNGASAPFTCTVDPMSGTANYEIRLTGNGVNKVLQSGSVSSSSAQKTVNVGPSQYNGVGTYTVTCTATETSCDPCCCTSDSESATLTVTGSSCPPDGWYCSASQQRIHKVFSPPTCAESINAWGEKCNDFDGCYSWNNGCEQRDYSCVEGNTNTPCSYTYSDRHSDSTDNYVNYCSGSKVKKHQWARDYYCDSGCTEHGSWINDQVVENCDDYDGWEDTSETRWVDNGVCKEKKQKKQEYRDYTCKSATVSCEYTVTGTQWVDTSETRNKVDGTTCNDGLWCTTPDYCVQGQCTGTSRDCSHNDFNEIARCDNVPDSIFYTWDYSSGFTSVCDEVHDLCTSSTRTFAHTCDVDRCDAECETDADCDDQNPLTVDICLENCTCRHEGPYCGDGTVQPPETCELPGTSNNPFCAQTTSSCNGNLTGTRDAFGLCNSACGCAQDPFQYSCVEGQCGATCDADSDCAPKCVDDVYYHGGACDMQSACACSYDSEDCDSKDGWYVTNETRWVADVICKEKEQMKKEYRDYRCALPDGCTYDVTDYTWIDTGNTRNVPNGTVCNDGFWCTDPDVCTDGACGGEPRDCSMHSYGEIAKCDNIPDSIYFTWDYSAGFTSVCDEDHDECTEKNRTYTHECDVERCDAECEDDADCDDGLPYTQDTCLANCTCEHEQGLCGNGVINPPETCEYPNTHNNAFCGQALSVCNGSMLGTRDMYGDCNGICGCAYDPFNYHCVAGECGAECDAKVSCPAKCVDGVRYYSGTCDMVETCGCIYETEDCDAKDGWYNTTTTRWVAVSDCAEKEQVKANYREYACAPNACIYQITDTSWFDTNNTRNVPDGTACIDGLWCTVGDYCSAGVCVREPRDCSANNYGELGLCDNMPDDNPFTWDFSHAFVSVCDETADMCTNQTRIFTHNCSIESCNASCEQDSDCDDGEPFTQDICLGNCSCSNPWVGGCGDQVCNNGETCASCPADCGTCPRSSGGGGGGSGGGSYFVASNWECGDWSTCINGEEHRTCSLNGVSKEEKQACTVKSSSGSGSSDSGQEDEFFVTSGFTPLESGVGVDDGSDGSDAFGSDEPILLSNNDGVKKALGPITGFSVGSRSGWFEGFNLFWLFVLVALAIAGYASFRVFRK
ncbi:hypothetical protein JW826_04535 [Candidatus Woesearchaeota archaeon]|nr:hypothetical protein [Candidatus Woesearchaeota archaeon]